MNQDDDLIEAMARAIWQAHEDRNNIRFTRQTWEQGTEVARRYRTLDAIHALRAYRERMVVL